MEKLIARYFFVLSMLATLISSQESFAQSSEGDGSLFSPDYFTISSVKVEKVEQPYEFLDQYLEQVESKAQQKNLGEVILAVDQLIALGEKVWPIIERGRPVVTTDLPTVNVLPSSVGPNGSLYELDNWGAPRSLGYRVTYKNLYGIEVIAFTYSLTFQPGGSFNGKGSYIAGATVTANNVSVSWGFDFSAKAEAVSITNRGTRANPVAGLTMRISYVAKSVFRDIRNSYNYHLTGRGEMREIDGY